MNDKIFFCQKLQRPGQKLDEAPYPGALGEKIEQQICAQAWSDWLAHQTTLINEYRLNPLEDQTITFLEQQMENYFFGDGGQAPAGFQAPDADKGDK